jgi:phosphomannomutase
VLAAGVGHEFVVASFKTAGLPATIPVVEQVTPDPDFPTVEYPNPEEASRIAAGELSLLLLRLLLLLFF